MADLISSKIKSSKGAEFGDYTNEVTWDFTKVNVVEIDSQEDLIAFLNSPIIMNHSPKPNISLVTVNGFLTCGRKSRARRIGPANSVGKKDTKNEKSIRFLHADILPL